MGTIRMTARGRTSFILRGQEQKDQNTQRGNTKRDIASADLLVRQIVHSTPCCWAALLRQMFRGSNDFGQPPLGRIVNLRG
jgi:hypothetical protein